MQGFLARALRGDSEGLSIDGEGPLKNKATENTEKLMALWLPLYFTAFTFFGTIPSMRNGHRNKSTQKKSTAHLNGLNLF
jgi:amino acid permease